MGRVTFEDRAAATANGKTIDLRRQRRAELARRVVLRAPELDPPDRELLLAVFDRGLRVTQVARLMGRDSDARSIRSRVRRLVARLFSPIFTFVASHRSAWSSDRARVATAYYLRGHSLRRVCADSGLTLHEVRQHLLAVDALFRAAEGRP